MQRRGKKQEIQSNVFAPGGRCACARSGGGSATRFLAVSRGLSLEISAATGPGRTYRWSACRIAATTTITARCGQITRGTCSSSLSINLHQSRYVPVLVTATAPVGRQLLDQRWPSMDLATGNGIGTERLEGARPRTALPKAGADAGLRPRVANMPCYFFWSLAEVPTYSLLPASGHAVHDIGSMRSRNRRAIGKATTRCRPNLYIASRGPGLGSFAAEAPARDTAGRRSQSHRHLESDTGPDMENAGSCRRC
ncbi:hypothetical protein B0J13DRAFT_603518 [Dactylonectria estremocensis]|uniref:Uncharacterized protein n=1 Tax=Dactylonectria estremocensis TaxID=1079267 RepID=A0A9P9JH78_9HYPO|nr:hypothetical protein B0J13DRAFT_603518 [Dactylonectria estremocensis]